MCVFVGQNNRRPVNAVEIFVFEALPTELKGFGQL